MNDSKILPEIIIIIIIIMVGIENINFNGRMMNFSPTT